MSQIRSGKELRHQFASSDIPLARHHHYVSTFARHFQEPPGFCRALQCEAGGRSLLLTISCSGGIQKVISGLHGFLL